MKKYLVGMMICLWSYVALAQAENLGMQDYAMRFAEVKMLQSDFTEEKHLALLNQPIQSEGNLVFDKQAQQLRWQYQKPFKNGFLMQRNHIYRIQDSRKIPIQNVMGRILADQMLVWLTLDLEALQKEYAISFEKRAIRFTPRAKDHKLIKQITVWLDAQDPRLVTQVKMEEPNGDFVLWKFRHTQLNPTLSDEVFL